MNAPGQNCSDLPLVLVTAGDREGEFEVLYEHLESLAREPRPTCQSLIVARTDLPDVLYQMLRIRTREMPHVHIRRLRDDPEDCAVLVHETGTFFATPRGKGKKG